MKTYQDTERLTLSVVSGDGPWLDVAELIDRFTARYTNAKTAGQNRQELRVVGSNDQGPDSDRVITATLGV